MLRSWNRQIYKIRDKKIFKRKTGKVPGSRAGIMKKNINMKKIYRLSDEMVVNASSDVQQVCTTCDLFLRLPLLSVRQPQIWMCPGDMGSYEWYYNGWDWWWPYFHFSTQMCQCIYQYSYWWSQLQIFWICTHWPNACSWWQCNGESLQLIFECMTDGQKNHVVNTVPSSSQSLTSSIGIGEFGMKAAKQGNPATFSWAVKTSCSLTRPIFKPSRPSFLV